jgi:hypothetical protein
MCREDQAYNLRSGIVVITSLSNNVAHWQSVCREGILGHCFSGTHYEDIQPIPLTPEILEKCGFIEIGKKCWAISIFEVFQSGKDDNEFFIDVKWLHYFKYLHQLQNIFFALTGEELKIEL